MHISIITFDSKCGYPLGQNPVPENKIDPIKQQVVGAETTIYYNATVEPYISVNPKYPNKIISVWHQSRISNGGSLEIGIAYSSDFGKTWTNTSVPLQLEIGGVAERLSDPWIVYNNEGTKVFLNALYFNTTFNTEYPEQQSGLLIVDSEDDGKTWSNLKFLTSSKYYDNEPSGVYFFDDKNMISVDPNNSSNLYCIWDRFDPVASFHSDTWMTKSIDGGKSWFPAYKIYDATFDLVEQGLSNGERENNQTIGNLIYRLPYNKQKNPAMSGDLLAFIPRIYATRIAAPDDYFNDNFPSRFTNNDICVIRSKDNGITWDTKSTIITNSGLSNCRVYTGGYEYDANGNIIGGLGTFLRTGDSNVPIVSINNSNGFIYLVNQTSVLRSDLVPQIGLTYSTDGGYTWSPITRVNQTPQNVSNPAAFTASVAVMDNGCIGILYFDFRNDDGSDPDKTKIDGWLAIYKHNCHGNLEFVKEIKVSQDSWIAQYGPKTTGGVMTNGDYQGLVAVDNYFYCLFTKTSVEPVIPPITIYEQQVQENPTIVNLDVNPRTEPHVTIVKVC